MCKQAACIHASLRLPTLEYCPEGGAWAAMHDFMQSRATFKSGMLLFAERHGRLAAAWAAAAAWAVAAWAAATTRALAARATASRHAHGLCSSTYQAPYH